PSMRQSHRISRILRPRKTFFSRRGRLDAGDARAHRLAIGFLLLITLIQPAIDSARTQAAPNSNDLAGQAGQATPLELGQSISRELAGGETHVYTLRVGAGEFFEACVDRFGMVVDIAVYSPSGQLVAQGDAIVENKECDMIGHIAAEAGVY